ncbi:hypothetical protein QYM36_007947 [Artemia franciscana]|nr:hypothetical protein QYM36_007947 [Artemia franciscana]
MAMRDLFQVVFDLKKKEIETAKRLADESRISNGMSSRRTDSVSSTTGLVRDKSCHSVITADLLDLESELCSLQEGLHHMGSLTTFKSVEDPLVGDSNEVLYDPFGDSFSRSFPVAKEVPPSKNKLITSTSVNSYSASPSGKKSPVSVSPLPPPVSKHSKTLPRKEKSLEVNKLEQPTTFSVKFDTTFPDPFKDNASFGGEFSFKTNGDVSSKPDCRLSGGAVSNEKKTSRETPPIFHPVIKPREDTVKFPKEVAESQHMSSSVQDPPGNIFSELDPLGTGKVRPYIDKKDFFQDLKHQQKKTGSKDFLPEEFQDVMILPKPSANDFISTPVVGERKSDEPEQIDPFGSLHFVPPEPDPFDTQSHLFGGPPIAAPGGFGKPTSSPTPRPRSGQKSPEIRRVSSTSKSPIPAERTVIARQKTLDVAIGDVKNDWSGSDTSIPKTPPLPPFPKAKIVQQQKVPISLSRILSHDSVSGSDSESHTEIHAPQPPPRPASVQPPPLPPKRVVIPGPTTHSSGSIRVDSEDEWATEDIPPLPAPSRKPRTRDLFSQSSYTKENRESMGQAKNLNTVTLAELSTMGIADLAATLQLPPAKLASMTLTELALRLSELTAEEEKRQRKIKEEEVEHSIESPPCEEAEQQFNATDRYRILGDSFEDDARVDHEPTLVSFRENSPSLPGLSNSACAKSFEFSPDFDSHFSKVNEEKEKQDRYAALREIFAAEGLLSEATPPVSSTPPLEENPVLESPQKEEKIDISKCLSDTNVFGDSFEPKWDDFNKEGNDETITDDFADRFPPASAFEDEESPQRFPPAFEPQRFPPASAFQDEEVTVLNRLSTNRQSNASSKSKNSNMSGLSLRIESASDSPSMFEDDFIDRSENNTSALPELVKGKSVERPLSVVSAEKDSISGTNFDDNFCDTFTPAKEVTPTTQKPEAEEKQNGAMKGFGDSFADFEKAYNDPGNLPPSSSVNIFDDTVDPFDDDFFQKPSVSRISKDFADDFIVENV